MAKEHPQTKLPAKGATGPGRCRFCGELALGAGRLLQNENVGIEGSLAQLVQGPFRVLLLAEPQAVGVRAEAGEVHFEVGLPGVVHDPGVDGPPVVFLLPVAQANGMVGHLPHVN